MRLLPPSLRSDRDNAKYLEILLLCGNRFHDLSALSHSQVSWTCPAPPLSLLPWFLARACLMQQYAMD